MSRFALNLPVDIPWKLIAVSPDMMDTTLGNKRFPFAWRSSMAISAYEPKPEELPEELCEERATFLKLTCTITGYQPTKEEIEQGSVSFPDVPTEDLQRILSEYFACYGVLLNVAVFPRGATMKRRQRTVISFGDRPAGQALPNPFPSGQVTFRATLPPNTTNNQIVDNYPAGGDQRGELNLFRQMEVTLPPTSRVEVRLVHSAETQPVTMEIYRGPEMTGTVTVGLERNFLHNLALDGEGIDRVIFRVPQKEASLLEFAFYEEVDAPIGLPDYPHIVDFEPKVRDLYQAATELGEVLTGSYSSVNTGKSLTSTENTQTSLGVGANTSVSVPIPGTPVMVGSQLSGNLTHAWGETNQESLAIQSDASRDRRERQATTTSITQMYNLLTGYHAGTNRTAFMMLPRPHTLQATDHRTFAKGLRMIEGVQEFFLIVTRPRGVEGLSVEALLETGHFPEKVTVEVPPVEYEEGQEDFHVSAYARGGTGPGGFGNAECKDIQETYTIATGWVIDRRPGKGDPDHPGVSETANDSNNQANTSLRNYNYQPASDGTVLVTGRICGANNWGPGAIFERSYRVFTRSAQPKPPDTGPVVKTPFLITSRALVASFRSGAECVEPAPVPAAAAALSAAAAQIVDEQTIRVTPDPLAVAANGSGRSPLLRDVLTKIQFAMSSSGRLSSRRPYGDVGFLESDYFKDRITELLPEAKLATPLASVEGLPEPLVSRLGGRQVGDVLKMSLRDFSETTGLNVEEAARARRHILGLPEKRKVREDEVGGE